MTMVSLEQRLEARREKLTPAVLRVARFLIDHPERALVATAAEIATSARTSDATVVRTVQLLGYTGLPELRREVGQRLVDRYDPRETLEQRVARVRDDPRSVLDTVIANAITVLIETRGVLDHDGFEEAVRLLAAAGRIIVMGWGTAGAAAEYAALSFTRVGYLATVETNCGFRISDSLAFLRADDVVLLLAPLLHVHEIDVTLSRASAVGARCLLVTELLGEKLRDRVDHVLTVASSQQHAVSEIVGLVCVLDALILGLSATRPDQARASWMAINELRNEFSTGASSRWVVGPWSDTSSVQPGPAGSKHPD